MTNQIEKQLTKLICTIQAKNQGNCDEADVQRELGALYYVCTKLVPEIKEEVQQLFKGE